MEPYTGHLREDWERRNTDSHSVPCIKCGIGTLDGLCAQCEANLPSLTLREKIWGKQ